jgi:HSP20 family protein
MDRLLRLQEELERTFERPLGGNLGLSGRGVSPPVNVFSDDEGYVIRLEVPGLGAEDLSIQARGRALTISGKRESAKPADASFHRRERWGGEFSRSLELPADAQTDAAQASCKNGILSVRVPKRAEARPRQIEVKS